MIFMKVSIEDNSIPNSALLDGYSGCLGGVASSSTATTDSSIITLVAGEDITAGLLVGIINNGEATIASYTGTPCIGVALDTVLRYENVRVRISGIADISNNSAYEYFLGESGGIRPYSYVPNKDLQYIGHRISDNQIYINIGKSILML